MGILDDAIREHLDLKRSHGATDSELRRLEDEAFGPPSRPGEPDFPESEEVPHDVECIDARVEGIKHGEAATVLERAMFQPTPDCWAK